MFVFGLSACDICNGQPTWMQMSEFGDVFKALTVSYLNFVDTDLGPKMLLKRPKWACKRATVALQLWPFQLSTVALSQVWSGRMGKSAGFSGGLRPAFHSGRRVFMEAFLLILFTTFRHSMETVFTDFSLVTPNTCHLPPAHHRWTKMIKKQKRHHHFKEILLYLQHIFITNLKNRYYVC